MAMAQMVVPPMALVQGWAGNADAWQHQLYEWAYQRARENTQLSWIERDPLGVWN
jgi:hypothetical protein